MKKVAAILLLCVLTFNLYGYQVLFNYLQMSGREVLKMQLSNDIPDIELTSIKVAVHQPPYIALWEAGSWLNGEIEKEGITYQCVKSRIRGDSVEYLCQPAAGKAESFREEFFKLSHDLQAESQQPKKPGGATLKPLSFEYVPFALASFNFPLFANSMSYSRRYQDGKISGYSAASERPPDRLPAA